MSGRTSHAGVFGKAPWHDDFLRPSALTTGLHQFDEWLFDNASACSEAALPSDTGRPSSYGFLLRLESAEPSRSVVGVLKPSNDRAGRSYPLALAAEVEFGADVAAHAEIAPIVLEEYWDCAVDALASIGAGRDASARGLERLNIQTVGSGDVARDLYLEWTRRTRSSELCEWLGWRCSCMERAIRAIARDTPEASDPTAPLHAPGGIRVPLGQSAGAGLCFWIDAIGRATRVRTALTSFLWAYDGEGGDALVFVGVPPKTTLATLWRTGGARTRMRICDLTSRGRGEGAIDPHRAACEGNVDGEDSTLSVLLERASARSRASARA